MSDTSQIPKEISEAGLEPWYASLEGPDRIKLGRYLKVNVDSSSKYAFFLSVTESAIKDENYKFATILSKDGMEQNMSDFERFMFTETAIEAFFGAGMYDDAKTACLSNLDLYSSVATDLKKMNGGSLSEKMPCRNRLIDIIVGVECQYDEGNEILDEYCKMGLISEEDLAYRKQSLKIHRLQRTFDGVYTYRPKE